MDAVLDKLAESGNLTRSCTEAGINKATFLRWVTLAPANADRYTRAREAGLDAEADRAISEALEAKDAGLGRLALDARKWYLSKLMPKKYGDKTLNEHTGRDGGPIQTQTEILDLSGADEAALRLLAGAKTKGARE